MSGLVGWVIRNARRSPLRGALTIVAVAICLLAFLLIRTVIAGWTDQVRETPDDRVLTRHKLGWGGNMPVHYTQKIREFAGVRHAMGGSWGGLSMPIDRRHEFDSLALDAEPFVAMHDELIAPLEEKRAFIADRRGAFVSGELARELGWKVGDVVHVRAAALRRDIPLAVLGIFESTRKGFARRALYFHWEYLNELLPPHERNRINIVAAQIEDPREGARLANAIDQAFAHEEIQTLSVEDQAEGAQRVAEFGAIFSALELVAVLVLAVIALLLGNTLAMTVRERRREYGTLRALGFPKRMIVTVILAEACLLGSLGGALALIAALPLIEQAASRYLAEAIGLPPLEVSIEAGAFTIVLGGLLGALSALVPAVGVTREALVDSLKRVT